MLLYPTFPFFPQREVIRTEKPRVFEVLKVKTAMASDQMRRKSNDKEDDRDIQVVKDRVPKMTTHFESLSEKAKDRGGGHEEEHGIGNPSLDEISELRGRAQQSSMEAIRAAEERYEKAKKSGSSKMENAKGYTTEKAVAARDAAVGTGKIAAGYAGNVADEVKGRTAMAGWGAAEYTLEKAVGATQTVAGAAATVAGYTGEKAVAAKDVVASAGHKVAEKAGETISAAKEAVVAKQESAKEYAARKKAEAAKDLEAKKSTDQAEEGTEGEGKGEQEKEQVLLQGTTSEEERGGGVLEAIGETIMEIGQKTKDLLIGGSDDNKSSKNP